MNEEITLEEFLLECQSDIENFKQEWLTGERLTPEHYPKKMALGEWFEQYLSFLGAGG